MLNRENAGRSYRLPPSLPSRRIATDPSRHVSRLHEEIRRTRVWDNTCKLLTSKKREIIQYVLVFFVIKIFDTLRKPCIRYTVVAFNGVSEGRRNEIQEA